MDLWQARGERDYELDDIMLLKVGRHLRPAPNYKLIIGREDSENTYLKGYRKRYLSLNSTSHLGPLALLDGTPDADDVEFAARVVVRYGQGKAADAVSVEVTFPDGVTKTLAVAPLPSDDVLKSWHV